MTGEERPRRVRVSFDSSATSPDRERTLGIALPGAPARDADAVFLSDLMRAQLRLAAACLIGFVLVSLTLTAAIMIIAATVDPPVFGVPLSWLLHAYAYYPVIVLFSIVFARSAGRNERRFRALSDGAHDRPVR